MGLLTCCMLTVSLVVPCLPGRVMIPQCSRIKDLPVACLLVCVGARLNVFRITAPLPYKKWQAVFTALLVVRAFVSHCCIVFAQGPWSQQHRSGDTHSAQATALILNKGETERERERNKKMQNSSLNP